MAAAELKPEVMCSICTDIYTNPVTLICGHSFCQDCITRTFDNQEDREYFCPECMKRFIRRPELKKNPRLSNIADYFHSVEPKGDSMHCPVSTVTLCLHCETFLRDLHKQTHNKSPEHVLADPITSLEDRKCPVHQKILEYYCTVENIFMCVDCLTSDPNGHRVSTRSTFLQQQTKNLRPILETLSSRKEKTEAMIQSLQEHENNINQGVDGMAERVTAIMRDIRRQHDDLEKRILADIFKQKQQISLSLSNHIQQLEKEKTELQKKIIQIEELSRNTNQLPILQAPERLFCVLEDNLDRGMNISTIHDTGDLEESVILETLSSGLSNIMASVEKNVHLKDAQTLSASANVNLSNRNVSNKSQIKAKVRVQSHTSSKSQTGEIAAKTESISIISGNNTTTQEMLLDVNTASNFLVISDDLKTVSSSEVYLGRPETPERFHISPQVISTTGISSGKHELEMEIRTTEVCSCARVFIGMCYPTIDRRGSLSLYEESDIWWGQWISLANENYNEIYFSKISSVRIKLKLDYEAGRLSFYKLCDPIKLVHTFTVTFTEPLYFIVSIQGGASVEILK